MSVRVAQVEDADSCGSDTAAAGTASASGDDAQRAVEKLRAMKIKALKKQAKELGVDEEKLDDADDEDDVKGTVIRLILEQAQPEPPPETQHEEQNVRENPCLPAG